MPETGANTPRSSSVFNGQTTEEMLRQRTNKYNEGKWSKVKAGELSFQSVVKESLSASGRTSREEEELRKSALRTFGKSVFQTKEQKRLESGVRLCRALWPTVRSSDTTVSWKATGMF